MRGGPPRRHGWIDSLLPDRVIRQALTLDGKRYTLVLVLPPGPRVFFGPHDIPGLGIGIAIITSGLMCYLLAWSDDESGNSFAEGRRRAWRRET